MLTFCPVYRKQDLPLIAGSFVDDSVDDSAILVAVDWDYLDIAAEGAVDVIVGVVVVDLRIADKSLG